MTDLGKIRVLSLEDNLADAELLHDALHRTGLDFEWKCVNNQQDFQNGVIGFKPDVILLDYSLPSYSGSEALVFAQANVPGIPAIIVTGTLGEIKAVELMKAGAVDYILKDRLARLADAVRHAILNARQVEIRKQLDFDLIQSNIRLKNSLIDCISSLASTVEMRDPYTAGHQRRVADLSKAIAKEMQLSADQLEGIHLGALVHDVGKLKVPAEILSKPGKLNELEFMLIKQHPKDGFDILKNGDYPWPIAQMVLQHHERIDGSGYPQGLKGKEIILEARIMAVADVVEAMSSHRPYRPGLGIDAALEEIASGRDKIYDPQVVAACLKLFKEQSYVLSV
jgi:putative two-component system response regulator